MTPSGLHDDPPTYGPTVAEGSSSFFDSIASVLKTLSSGSLWGDIDDTALFIALSVSATLLWYTCVRCCRPRATRQRVLESRARNGVPGHFHSGEPHSSTYAPIPEGSGVANPLVPASATGAVRY